MSKQLGRYDKISRCDRICPVCGLNIEDEIHFQFNCPKYSSIRDDFLNSTDYYLNKQLVRFVSSCLEMRDNLLSKV